METVAIVLLLLPVLAFAGYPVVLLAVARFASRPPATGAATADLPVVVVICAYNEGPRIGAKLESVVAALVAWGGRGHILVADDGSSDDTAAVAATFPQVDLVRLPRGGKAAALNRVAPRRGDAILVMTDADPLFEASTIPALLAPFADADVGAVAGRVEPIVSRASGFDRIFRSYESAMRRAENDLFGCVSADGGLYAIRAALMPIVPADVTDDFYISTAVVAAGHRIAFADDARAWEESIVGGRRNLRRRIRITVRGLTALWSRRALMNPARTGWYAPALIFHKVARRLSPLALPPLWVLSALLAVGGSAFWALVFAGMTAVAMAGVVGLVAPGRLPKIMSPVHAVALHLAGLTAGAILFAGGCRYTQWTPQKGPA